MTICGEWFTATGVGENLGYIGDKKKEALADKLRTAAVCKATKGNSRRKELG